MSLHEHTSAELFSIWKRGKSLDEASITFGDHNQAAQEVQNSEKIIPPSSKDKKTNQILMNLGNSLNTVIEPGIIREKMKNKLVQKLCVGKLISIGYEIPRKRSDNPFLIPEDIWINGKIDWAKSSVTGNGLEFVSVRILKKLPKIKKHSPNISLPMFKIEDKPVGRPSKKDRIIKAYDCLRKNKQINYSKTFKSHTKAIQATVRSLFSDLKDNKGLGEETIRRTVGDQFEAERATSKSTSKL